MQAKTSRTIDQRQGKVKVKCR